MTFGTPRLRGIALWAGLALLAAINYLDLIGILALNLDTGTVGLATAIWTGTVVGWIGPDFEEIWTHARPLLGAGVAWAVGAIALGARYPNAGDYYRIHATTLGQLELAASPVVVLSVLTVAFTLAIAWVLEWRRLSRSSPEERVLERAE